ncbi:hypothetical protein ACEN3H_12700 [Acinetobacter lactucae]|uniref:hypothetical protein n=1 Tax=Acinetobacter lactucae TaxID=1785128 RepID=UPI00358DBC61
MNTLIKFKSNMRSSYRLLVDYKNFLKENDLYNDYQSRSIFVKEMIKPKDFIFYGVDGPDQLISQIEKNYFED